MLILAIETTADLCSIVVRDAAGTLAERVFRHRMHLSERLIDDVDALLHDSGASLAGIDGLAVGIGPGSFTGVRIGVMTAKTWADALGKPIAGIGSLEAIATEHALRGLTIVPIIRARPDSVYTQSFVGGPEGELQPQTEPAVMSVEELADMLGKLEARSVMVCGDGLARHRDALEPLIRGHRATVALGRAGPPRASVIAEIAEKRLLAGLRDDPLALIPLYIAPPNINLAGG